jgi:hypothetical protein
MILQEISSKEERQPEMSLQTVSGLVVRGRSRMLQRGCSKYKIQDEVTSLPICFVITFLSFHASHSFLL